jgi:hypothetical protein
MSGFQRLVLELGHGAADPATIRQAVAYAQLLGAELHALFVEDETLLHASGLPFAREISAISHQWRKLEPDRIEAELRAAADQAHQHLREAAAAIGVRHQFEVRRGDLALHVSDICVPGDVVVVAPSRHETTHGSHRLLDTAHRSPAAVLFLPRVAGPGRGPVVALAMDRDDPSLATARRIATRGRETLVVLTPQGSALCSEIGDDEGTIRCIGTAVADMAAALGDTRERLIVITRAEAAAQAGVGLALGAARGVAVLVVEPVMVFAEPT